MFDDKPVHIIAISLLLSAGSLIPYLLSELKSPFGKQFDVSPNGFILITLSTLTLATIFSTFLGPSHLPLTIALALGIILSLLHPVAAICFFVSLLFLRPWEFLQNNALLKVLPRLMAAITAGTWLVGLLRTRKNTFVLGSSSVLFILLLGWVALSCLFSVTPGASLKMLFEAFAPTTVLSFLIVNSLHSEKDLRTFSRSFVISGVGIVSVAFYTTYRDYMTGVSDFRLHGSGLWGNANDLAALAVLMLPLTLISLKAPPTGGSRGRALIATIIFVIALLWSQSRAAQGAALVAGVLYVVLCGGGVRLGLLLIPAIVVIAIIAAAMPQRDVADTEGSSESRYNYVIAGFRMARAHPVFGIGVGNYPYLYEQYTPAFIESGNRTAHSSWVLILSETGFMGLFLLWLLYGSVLRRAWGLRRTAPQYILSMVTYGIVMSFLSHTYLFLPYVFMAFIIAASRAFMKSLPECKDCHVSSEQPRKHVALSLNVRRGALLLIYVFVLPLAALADTLAYLGGSAGLQKPMPGEARVTSPAITLKGSRGEVLSFLLKAEGAGCFPLTHTWNVSESTPPPLKLTWFDLPEVTTENPSYTGARIGSFVDPAVPFSQAATLCVNDRKTPHWVLGEITIAKDIPAGRYTARVSAGTHTVTIDITVWPMVIPDKPAMPAYSELTPWFLVLAHHGGWHEDEAKLAHLYSSAMVEHRVVPLKSIIAPLKDERDGSKLTLDLEKTPTAAASFQSVVLHTRPAWAYFDFPTVGANGAKPIDYPKTEQYFAAVQNTLPKTGRDGKAIVYLWDEPKKDAVPELVKLSRLVKRVAPNLKQLVTTPYDPSLKNTVDIFAPVMDQFDADGYPAPSTYRELQKEGHEIWWYVSCMSHGCDALRDSKVPDLVIDRAASYVRSIGWLSMRYSIDAFLYYSVNNGFQFAQHRDPWKSLWDFSGNGDGTLFYPGRPGEHGLTTHQPIASIRLKLWRESSFDAEYIKWMNELPSKPSWWENERDSLVSSTTSWDRDYSKYQSLRDKAGDYLSGRWLQ